MIYSLITALLLSVILILMPGAMLRLTKWAVLHPLWVAVPVTLLLLASVVAVGGWYYKMFVVEAEIGLSVAEKTRIFYQLLQMLGLVVTGIAVFGVFVLRRIVVISNTKIKVNDVLGLLSGIGWSVHSLQKSRGRVLGTCTKDGRSVSLRMSDFLGCVLVASSSGDVRRDLRMAVMQMSP